MRGDLCSGCGACAGLAPKKILMETQPPGYLRPKQLDTLSEDEEVTISAVCPGLGQQVIAAGRQDSPLWGPYLRMVTGWASNEEVRYAGSSGGILTALLIHLLERGSIDAVVQTAADPLFPIGNSTVITNKAEEILAAAGSRYAPSAPLSELSRLITDGRRLAFVGKPCDSAALRAILERNPGAEHSFPVILSFFCAGVPSHEGGLRVLQTMGTSIERTAKFRFRGRGWPGETAALLADGSKLAMSYHDSWGGILSKHVQHRCKICADGTGAAADLVCADAWDTDERGYPIFADRPGVSLIVVRTAAGADLLNEAERAGVIEVQDFNIDGLQDMQPGQRERKRALAARLAALRLLGRPIPRYRGLKIFAAARQNSFGRLVRNFLGTLRRSLRF